jgi:hypothetical protein
MHHLTARRHTATDRHAPTWKRREFWWTAAAASMAAVVPGGLGIDAGRRP